MSYKKQKIKVLTINWSDKEGSIAKIIKDIKENLDEKCIFYHCYQVGDAPKGTDYRVASWNITRFYYLLARIVGLKYGVGTLPTVKTLKYIQKINPDLVHVHCPNFYNLNLYMLFAFLKRKQIPTLITNHAEFYYTGNCAHAVDCEGYLTGCHECKRVFDVTHKYLFNRTAYEWKKMKLAFNGTNRFAMSVVSPWQMKRIKTSPITKDIPVFLVENSVDTNIFCLKDIDFMIKRDLKKNYEYIILHVTSNFSDDKEDLKGGYYLIETAEKLPNYQFLVAGNINVKKGKVFPSNIILLGNITLPDKLADLYNIADLTVLTSRRETFGMACAESLCCGTPVVGFEAGGTETITIQDYSKFVTFGDVDRLVEAIKEMLDLKGKNSDTISKRASEKYGIRKMADNYYKLYDRMVNV